MKSRMMKKATEVFRQARQILTDAGCESASFDASCIFEYCYKLKRTELFLSPDLMVEEEAFLRLCKKRASGYPLQYIVGQWQFMGFNFEVNENVLIPRADTETLVEYILSLGGSPRILDMCTGSGCIGISLALLMKGARVTLADISDGAIEITRKNAMRHGIAPRIMKTDLLDGYEKYFKSNSFDIIVSNPPYIKSGDMELLQKEVLYEPHVALFGGEDGLKFYTALINLWKDALTPSGLMVLEAGYDTWQDIVALFEKAGFCDIVTKKDAGGNVRLVCAKNNQ